MIISNSGKVTYGVKNLLVDIDAEKEAINTANLEVGSIIYVTQTSKKFILNTKKQWDLMATSSSGGSTEEPSYWETI